MNLTLDDEAVQEIAARAAEIVRAELRASEPHMDADEAGRYIGSNARRIYDLITAGKLPDLRDGRKVLVRRSDLDAYLASR